MQNKLKFMQKDKAKCTHKIAVSIDFEYGKFE